MHLTPNPKSEVFNLRMTKTTRTQLERLSSDEYFKNNCSEVLRFLINQAYTQKCEKYCT
jgi:hypothetical protein